MSDEFDTRKLDEEMAAAGAEPREQATQDTTWEEFKVAGSEIVDKVKELLHEGNVRRIVIRQDGRTVFELPLTIAAVGVIAAPVLAAIGAFAALATNCTSWSSASSNSLDPTHANRGAGRRLCPAVLSRGSASAQRGDGLRALGQHAEARPRPGLLQQRLYAGRHIVARLKVHAPQLVVIDAVAVHIHARVELRHGLQLRLPLVVATVARLPHQRHDALRRAALEHDGAILAPLGHAVAALAGHHDGAPSVCCAAEMPLPV